MAHSGSHGTHHPSPFPKRSLREEKGDHPGGYVKTIWQNLRGRGTSRKGGRR